MWAPGFAYTKNIGIRPMHSHLSSLILLPFPVSFTQSQSKSPVRQRQRPTNIPWPRFHQPLRQGERSTGRCGSQTSWIQRRWAFLGWRWGRQVKRLGSGIFFQKAWWFLSDFATFCQEEWNNRDRTDWSIVYVSYVGCCMFIYNISICGVFLKLLTLNSW